MNQKISLKEKMAFMVPTAVFLIFTLLIYGPLGLYLPNAQELWFKLSDVLRCVLIAAAVVLVVLLVLAAVLPGKLSVFFTKLVFGGTLGLYLQGNLMNIRYGSGVMDGTAVHWEYYTKYAVINTGIWIICLLLPFLPEILEKLAGKKQRKLPAFLTNRKTISLAALFLTAIQIPAFAVQLATFRPNEQELVISREGIYELSDSENTILMILDTLDEAYYADFLEAHPEFTQQLEGFTHYGNTLAAAARTIVALPAMLTGQPFKRESTFTEYLKETWSGENVLKEMNDAGVNVRVYSNASYFDDSCAAYVENFSADGQKIKSDWILTKKLYKMTLSRFLPHLLKKYVWFDTSEFNEAKKSGTYSTNNDPKFFKDYKKTGFTYTGSYDKAFRVYHLNGSHEPHIMDSLGERTDKSNLRRQNEGCFCIVETFLNDLKESGHYDDATIILTADHGNLNVQEQPFFLYKKAGDTGEYRDDDCPLSLFDLPGILRDTYGIPQKQEEYGLPLEEVETLTERERHFFQNISGSSKVLINEYVTSSRAGDYEAMQLVESHEDTQGADTPYALGTELSFMADATANIYTIEGFTQNTGFRTLMAGPYGEMQIPIQDELKDAPLSVLFTLASSTPEVELVIEANGEEVYHGKTDEDTVKNGLAFEVPAAPVTGAGNTLTLKFTYPEISEDEMKLDAEQRTRTISLTGLVISQ